MKSLKMILALVLVLAMTGTTFAAFSISGNLPGDGTDLGNGLTSYTISTKGVNVYEDLVIGGVHQLTYDGMFGPVPTPSMTSLPGGAFPVPAHWVTNDTHFLFLDGDVSPTAGGIVETNTQSGSPLTDVVPEHWGMGTLGGAGNTFGFLGGDETVFRNLIQVVIPTGTGQLLTGVTFDAAGSQYALEALVGVPEPSTILMLLVGSLCLLAVRSRK